MREFQLVKLQRSRTNPERDIDQISLMDKYSERRKADLTRKLDGIYDEIYRVEDLIEDCKMKLATLEREKLSRELRNISRNKM